MNDKIDIGIAEDEDLARAKAWWKENGSSIIGGIAIGTVMVVGYNFWQSYQDKHANEVAELYESYENSDADKVALEELVKTDDSAVYAQLARMSAAKTAMQADQFDQAEQLLNSILESGPDEGLRSVAVLRLATVYLAAEKPDAALALLDEQASSDLPLMKARVEELQGDIYLHKGDKEAARSHYESSITLLSESRQATALVQLKLDNL